MTAPCLFNIKQDPCEMVNLAERTPLILAIFETILIRHRLTMIPPSNLDGDPRSDPSLWNNTWTSWAEPNPLMLANTNIKQLKYSANQVIAINSIIFCSFFIGVIIIFKCWKTNSNLRNPEYQNYHERVTCTIDSSEKTFSISSIVPDTRRNDTPRHEDIN